MLKGRLAEVTTGQFIGPQIEKNRVEELAQDLLRDYKINARKSLDDVKARWTLHLEPFFSGFRTVDVTSELLSRFVDSRQQEGASNATINRELAPQTDVPTWAASHTTKGHATATFPAS